MSDTKITVNECNLTCPFNYDDTACTALEDSTNCEDTSAAFVNMNWEPLGRQFPAECPLLRGPVIVVQTT